MVTNSKVAEEQQLLAETTNAVHYNTEETTTNVSRPKPSFINDNTASSDRDLSLPSYKQDAVPNVRARLKFIFPALAIGIFLAAADQTIIVSSYGRIGSELRELDRISWLTTAYLCTTTAFQPLYGKLGDIFGRKTSILFAYSVFDLGALLCGLSQDMNQLIASRALTGVGAGGILTSVSVLLSDVVTLEERGIWQSYVNMIFALGAGLGAPLGGLLTDAIGWRWAFIAQVPLCTIAILFVALLLEPSTKTISKSNLASVDFLGATTLIIGLTSLLVFLDRMASDSATWEIYLWLTGSILLLSAFLWVEKKVATTPITPLNLLFGREFLGAYFALAFGNAAWYGVVFNIPLLYQAVGRFSPSGAGAALLPGICSGVIGGFVGGAFLKRRAGTGFRSLALYSYPLVTLSCSLIAFETGIFWTSLSTVVIVTILGISLFVGGLGNGGGMTATLIVVVAVASPSDQAIITACVYLYRQLGATVGIAAISLTFRRVLTWSLVKRLHDRPSLGLDANYVVQRVRESLNYLDTIPIEARLSVEAAYTDACRAAFCLCTALGVCTIIFACYIKEKRVPTERK